MPELWGSVDAFAEPILVAGKGELTAVIDPAGSRAPPLVLLDKPRRLLRTAAIDYLAAGDVVTLQGGESFIAAEQGAGPLGVSRSWVLFDVTGIYALKRLTTTTDTVTGVQRAGGSPTTWTQPLCVEPLPSRTDSGSRVAADRYRVVSGTAILPRDFVTVFGRELPVDRVDQRMGVWVGELG